MKDSKEGHRDRELERKKKKEKNWDWSDTEKQPLSEILVLSCSTVFLRHWRVSTRFITQPLTSLWIVSPSRLPEQQSITEKQNETKANENFVRKSRGYFHDGTSSSPYYYSWGVLKSLTSIPCNFHHFSEFFFHTLSCTCNHMQCCRLKCRF